MAAADTGRGAARSERYKEPLGAALPKAFLIEPRFSGQILPSISHILKSNKPTERRVGVGVCVYGLGCLGSRVGEGAALLHHRRLAGCQK